MKKFVAVIMVVAMLLTSLSAFAAQPEQSAPADIVATVTDIAAQVSMYCALVQDLLIVAKDVIDQISVVVAQVDQMAQLIVVAAYEVSSIQESIVNIQSVIAPAMDIVASFVPAA